MASATHKDKPNQEQGGTAGMGQGRNAGQQGTSTGLRNVGDKAGEIAKNVGDKAGDMARHAAEEAKGLVGAATEKASEAASFVGHKAGDAAKFIGEKADSATDALGSSMEQLGHTIRDKSPKDGIIGQTGQAVASTLESGGRYLEEHNLQQMGDDITGMIRRHPVPALLIGIGIGFLVARATRS